MGAKTGFYGEWERLGLYHMPMAAYGDTRPTTPASIVQLMETSGGIIHGHPEIQAPGGGAGHGKPWLMNNQFLQSRAFGRASFTLPFTSLTWRDMLILLLQNATLDATYYAVAGYTSPTPVEWAYLMVALTAETGTHFAAFEGLSMVPSELSISTPQVGGNLEMGVQTLGYSAGRIDDQIPVATVDQSSETIDSGSPVLPEDCQVSIDLAGAGAADYDIVDLNVTLSNGLTIPKSNKAVTPGLVLGRMGWDGSIKVMAYDVEAAEDLYTALLAKTIVEIKVEFDLTGGDNHFFMSLPVLVTNMGEPENVDGALALGFDFTGVGDTAGDYVPSFQAYKAAGGSSESLYYNAP